MLSKHILAQATYYIIKELNAITLMHAGSRATVVERQIHATGVYLTFSVRVMK